MSSDYLSGVKPWTSTGERLLARTRIFDLNEKDWTCEEDASKSGSFVQIRSRDWVNVIAVTPSDELVMVEQFRFGSECVTLEPVAGIVEAGEDPMETCRRELREETGYVSDGGVKRIGWTYTNPAILTNKCHYGLLTDVRPTGERSFDQHEQLATRLVPVADAPGLIAKGVITHALAVCAVHFYMADRAAGPTG
ncbi:MAG: NUDIX hydrolase [Phycisphaerales bacterium JB058]